METDGWQPARLIPTSGINGQDEAERRAASALLAVLQGVREFRTAVLKPLGAPAGNMDGFIEVPFKLPDERTVYPDGLLRVTRGKTEWTSLVEVKTGTACLEREQVECYLDIARASGFDSVLTISNQLAPAPGVHPVEVDRRKLRKVALQHMSWAEVLTMAVRTRVHNGVSDPDQAWILAELIRYLEHPKSGALDFSDMGSHWTAVRDAVAAGTLRTTDKGVAEVASRWDQLLRFTALRLGRELGADVQVVVPRKELAEPATRITRFAAELADSGTVSGSVRIPDATGPIEICADLRAATVSVSVDVDAPAEGRLPTRVGWLVRQLQDSPPQLRIDAYLQGSRSSTSELLSTVREDPTVLVDPQRREFRLFRVTATSSLGTKRGTGRGSFIDSVLSAVDGFYEGVVQGLRPWTAKAPRLPKSPLTAAEEAGIDTSPPPEDMTEPSSPDDAPASPPEAPRPIGATSERSNGDCMENSAAVVAARAANPFVNWDAAEQRLEHERRHDAAEER